MAISVKGEIGGLQFSKSNFDPNGKCRNKYIYIYRYIYIDIVQWTMYFVNCTMYKVLRSVKYTYMS